jgi:hypothetical protein
MNPGTGAVLANSSFSPLERFLRDYAEVAGGMWDEIEPQVYDLMLPGGENGVDSELVRIAFDPEAIPEHPGAQLASYGTPLVDRLLADAVERGRHVELYMTGLNLAPVGLEDRLRRGVSLPPGFRMKVEGLRPLHFPQAVFWFEATFTSDQKEQDILSVAIDLHHGRQVRHLERLLDSTRLAETPYVPLAEARHPGLAAAYPLARDRVVRTLAALSNARHRELADRLNRQLDRISRYYSDLRAEVEEQARKAKNRNEDPTRFAGRLEALQREEHLRGAELRLKSQLKVHLRLLNLLVIHQPKLLLRTAVSGSGTGPHSRNFSVEWVWDPLVENFEAAVCPQCGHPTFEFVITHQRGLACPACTATLTPSSRR